MQRAMVLLVVALLTVRPAWALDRPGDTTLVDETFRLAPGAELRQCLDVPEMVLLTAFASSPPGRTGESAMLDFSDNRQTVSPNVQLTTGAVPDEEIMSTHLAPAGSYCYYIVITHNLTSPLPDDAPEKPYKQVHLKIVSTPYAP